MKRNSKILTVLLSLAVLMSILSATAIAAPKEDKSKDSVSAEEVVKHSSSDEKNTKDDKADLKDKKDNENKSEKSKNVNKDEAEKAQTVKTDESEKKVEPETVTVEEGKVYYAQPDTVVFNNGGTVYNNDATVYNNGGVVYNNLGVVYNNGGTIYANGGTVYNNSGTVYDNGAEILSPGVNGEAETDKDVPVDEDASEKEASSGEAAVPEAEVKDGFYKIELADDYSNYVEFEDLDEAGQLYIGKDDSCTFKLKPSYKLSSYELTSGEFNDNRDGSFIISKVSENAKLELEFEIAAPVFNIESGTYIENQEIEISAADGAQIFYTTDGSDPDEKSEVYEGPVLLENGCVIKAVAVSDELGSSSVSKAEIAIVKIDVPEFKDAKKGYGEIKPRSIELENDGDVDAVIKKMSLSGENSNLFRLSEASQKTVPAGETVKNHWRLNPLPNLEPGEYSAVLTVETGSGETADFEIGFNVK